MQGFIWTAVIITALLFLYFVYARSKGNQSTTEKEMSKAGSTTSESDNQQEKKRLEFEKTLESLIQLNLEIRTNPELVSMEMESAELTIDLGIRLLPKVADRYPDHEIAWEICRLLGHWLPKHVNSYSAMNGESRSDASAKFIETMKTMQDELIRIDGMIEQGLEMEFSSALSTIQLKYGNN